MILVAEGIDYRTTIVVGEDTDDGNTVVASRNDRLSTKLN